jgi:hypothetical protein
VDNQTKDSRRRETGGALQQFQFFNADEDFLMFQKTNGERFRSEKKNYTSMFSLASHDAVKLSHLGGLP